MTIDVRRVCAIAASVIVILACPLGLPSGDAAVIQVGAGADLSAGSLDGSGSRLNIDNSIYPAVDAGVTYDVLSFQYKASTNVGNVQPFLAVLTGTNTYEVIWVGPTLQSPPLGGIATVAYDLGTYQITRPTDTDVYAGFNASTNTVYYGAGVTDHNNQALFSIGVGSTIGPFSNNNLSRSYAFEVNLSPAATAADTLTWDGSGDGNWTDAHWTGGSSATFPDADVFAVVQTDTVSVTGAQQAQRLTVESGGVSIGAGGSLTFGNIAAVIVDSGATLTLDGGSTGASLIATNGGGSISSLVLNGLGTISNAVDLSIDSLSDGGAAGTLTKQGTGDLILTAAGANAISGGTNFDVQAGRLVAVHNAGNNALGNGSVTLNGGGMVLSSTAAATFDNPVTVTQSGVILAQAVAPGVAGQTITLGSAANGISIDSGRTLTLSAAHNYTLVAGGTISGQGGLTVSCNTGSVRLDADNSYAGQTTIARGTLQVGNGGASGTLGTGNVANSGALVMNRSDDVTLVNVISGTGTFNHAGAGTLTLNSANTFTGNTSVTGSGVLRLANSLALQNSTLASSAVEFDQSVASNAFTLGGLSGGGAIVLENNAGTPVAVALSVGNNGQSTEFSGNLSGAGSLVKIGSGTLTLSGTNSYVGKTAVNAGVLSISSTDALPGWNAGGRYSVADGAALAVGHGVADGEIVTILGTGNFASGASVGFDTSDGDRTYGGAIANTSAGTLGLVKIGAGVLTLSAANTYTGTTSIRGGTLRLGSAAALPSGRTIAMSGDGTLDLNGYDLTVGNIASSAATNTITDNSGVAGTSTLTISGGAPATVNAIIEDGATRQVAVVLCNGNSGATPFNVTSANTFSGGLLLLGDASWQTRLRISSAITTSGSAGAIVSSPFGTGAITIGSAATDRAAILFDGASNNRLVNDVVFNTTQGTDVVGGIRLDTTGNTFSGTLTANLAAASFNTGTNRTGSATLTGQVTGTSGLVLYGDRGALTITLNNATGTANDYQGDTVIGLNIAAGKSAILKLGASNQLPNGANAGNVVIHANGAGAGILDLNGSSDTINGLSGTGIVDNTAAGAVTLTVGDNNASSTFDGVLCNTGGMVSLRKIGSGTLALTGENTYTGVTTLEGGILNVASLADYGVASAAGAREADTSPSNIGFLFRGGTLQYTGDTAQSTNRAIRVSTNGGAVLDASGSNPDATLSFTASSSPDFWENSGNRSVTFTGTNTGYNTFNMAITQINGLTTVNKTGAGTWVLSGNSSYTGATTVSSGTLLVTGALGNTPVAVQTGATLGGTGSIAGTVTVNGGGTFSPGLSPGVLSVGSLLLEAGSTTLLEIDGLTRDDEYDGVDITTEGGLTYGGALSLDFGNTSAFAAGTVLDLFDFTGTASGAFSEVTSTGYYSGDWISDGGDGFSLEAGWQTLLFSHATGDVTIVPEPAAWILLVCALVGGLLARRRKMA